MCLLDTERERVRPDCTERCWINVWFEWSIPWHGFQPRNAGREAIWPPLANECVCFRRRIWMPVMRFVWRDDHSCLANQHISVRKIIVSSCPKNVDWRFPWTVWRVKHGLGPEFHFCGPTSHVRHLWNKNDTTYVHNTQRAFRKIDRSKGCSYFSHFAACVFICHKCETFVVKPYPPKPICTSIFTQDAIDSFVFSVRFSFNFT